jgi:septal ring factor EnvC (AmiA/AmiB activator)
LGGEISDSDREEVIRRRLSNQTFDRIAFEMGISHGSAVKIQKDSINKLEQRDASAVLTLGRVINKQGITPAQCAEGARLVAIMQQLGATPENLDRFLSDLNSKVITKGMAPSAVATTLMQASTLSQELEVPLDRIPEALKNAYDTLDEINAQITDSSSKLAHLRDEVQSALDEAHATHEKMALFLNVEKKLGGLSLSLDNLDDIVNVIYNMKELGSDPSKLAMALATVNSLQEQKQELEADIEGTQEHVRFLEEEIAETNTRLAALSEIQEFLNRFDALGINKNLLEDLLFVITEIAEHRSIPLSLAAAFFLAEVVADYEAVLGFKAALQNLEDKIRKASAQLEHEETTLAELRDAVNAITLLHNRGVREKHLVDWEKVMRDHPELSAEMLSASLKEYADVLEAIVAAWTKHKTFETAIDALKLNIDALNREHARAAADLLLIRKATEDEQRIRQEVMQQLLKQERESFRSVAVDAIQYTSKHALMEGISLHVANSPLLPIISSENGGPQPKPKEMLFVAVYVLNLLRRSIGPSDPLTTEISNADTAINKRLSGEVEYAGTPGRNSNSNA